MMHRKRQLCVGSTRAHPPRRRPRILVVDDDLVLCVFQTEVLASAGFEVDMAEDGEAGWQALQSKEYDLLITDNQMPRLSGLELLKKLRAEEHDLPVMMVSGAIPTEELKRSPWLRLSAALPKPFTGDQLLKTVTKIVSESQRRPRATRSPAGSLRRALSPAPARVMVSTDHLPHA